MVRLIYVVGTPSGGTSATAGTLMINGFYSSARLPNTEPPEASKIFKNNWLTNSGNMFDRPLRKPTKADFMYAADVFATYKEKAAAHGFNRAVMKWPGLPAWIPELLDTWNLGVEVEPLLVYRDPDRAAASAQRFVPDFFDAPGAVYEGQLQIKKLHERYGWPMWEFGKNADVSRLEKILGVALPNTWFDPAIIKS